MALFCLKTEVLIWIKSDFCTLDFLVDIARNLTFLKIDVHSCEKKREFHMTNYKNKHVRYCDIVFDNRSFSILFAAEVFVFNCQNAYAK